MASEEQLVLDGLTLNDATFGLEALDFTPPSQRQEWIGGADSEWQALMRAPLHNNREITATVAILGQSTRNLAMDKIGLIVDKFRLASLTPDGVDLVWTPADGTRSITFDCLAGEVVGMPIDDLWLLEKQPTIQLKMTCKPYGYSAEVTGSTASSSTPFVTQTVSYSTGDIPGLGRLIVTDTGTASRRHVEWGLENQYYNAATSYLIDSDDMVTSGFSGTQTTTAGGTYDPNASGNDSITASILTTPTAIAGTGNLSHVGTFRVKAKVITNGNPSEVEVRLVWREADGPWSINDWTPMQIGGSGALNNYEELDVGSITVPPTVVGTQRWTGKVEARTTTGTATVVLDYLILIPTMEGYGKARAVPSNQTSTLAGYDQFTSTTAPNALGTRAAPLGGSWATSGDAGDFLFSDAIGEELVRAGVSDSTTLGNGRTAILGTTNYTDMQVEAKIRWTATLTSGIDQSDRYLLARYVDASNYAFFRLRQTGSSTTVSINRVVSGVNAIIAQQIGIPNSTFAINSWFTFRFLLYASGTVQGTIHDQAGGLVVDLRGANSVFATGGTLDDGKPGIRDQTNSASTTVSRYYDDFSVSVPPAEPIVLYSGRNMQIRHDGVIRQDSTGTYTGRPPSYRGSRFLVPPGTSRVMVKARDEDVDTSALTTDTRSTQIQIAYMPRHLVVPRS